MRLGKPHTICHPECAFLAHDRRLRLLPERTSTDLLPMSDHGKQQFVTVARILRPRGNKGEISAELLTDFPDRLKTFREVFLAGDNATPHSVQLKSFWADRNHP